MRLSYRLVFPFIVPMLLLVTDHAWPTHESTARLKFEKNAAYRDKQKRYIVRKGDRLNQIIYSQYGRIPHSQMKSVYAAIRQLNPQLLNPGRIYEGQVLILPGNLRKTGSQGIMEGTQYTIRKGDSLTRILIRDFGLQQQDVPAAIKKVRTLNPELRNTNQIRVGQILLFPYKAPDSSTHAKAENPPAEKMVPEAAKAENPPAEKMAPEAAKAEQPAAEMQSIPRIEVIRQILREFDGSLTTRGNYFLPLNRRGQLTIDCTIVPVAELKDGSVILLDLMQRLPEKTKKLIRTSGKRYSIVSFTHEEPIETSLQKVFNASRSYRMARCTQPVIIGEKPQIILRADWLVTQEKSLQKHPISYALILSREGEASQPASIVSIGEKRGWKIMGINAKTGIVSAAETKDEQDLLPVMPSWSPIGLIAELLDRLGIPETRNTSMQIYQVEKDGFNLNVQIDLAVENKGKHILFNGKKIPQQFSDILKQRGFELVILDASLSKQSAVEKALTTLSVPFANGDYSFPVMTTDRTRADVRFSATKINVSKSPWYLISFDFDPDLYHLIHRNGDANIVRY